MEGKMFGTDQREYRYQQEIYALRQKLSFIENSISNCELDIQYCSREISNLESKIRNAQNEAQQYLYGYNFSRYHENYNELTWHKNRIAGEYESEKNTKQRQLNSRKSELDRLKQEKSSIYNKIFNCEREIAHIRHTNNVNKMLEENSRKHKEQQAQQRQQIERQSRPTAHTPPVPLASPETIKNELNEEQIIQMLKAHRKPTPTTLFGEKRTGFEKITLAKKTKNEANISVITDNHFYSAAKITFTDKQPSGKRVMSYIKKQIIPLKRGGRENQ